LKKYQKQLQIGSLDTKPKPPAPAPVAAPAPKKPAPTPKVTEQEDEPEPLEPFGPQIPFADPAWYQNVR
jgi:hypothetical protein